ncbi:MAG: TrmH family RNA methyltransferase, partial [Xanthobacteraceae bacterium]
ASWEAFDAWRRREALRLVLLTTRAEASYLQHGFGAGDVILLGRESSGVPGEVHAAAEVRVRVPMRPGLRSLNVAMAAAMVAGEAMRQDNLLRSLLAQPAARG